MINNTADAYVLVQSEVPGAHIDMMAEVNRHAANGYEIDSYFSNADGHVRAIMLRLMNAPQSKEDGDALEEMSGYLAAANTHIETLNIHKKHLLADAQKLRTRIIELEEQLAEVFSRRIDRAGEIRWMRADHPGEDYVAKNNSGQVIYVVQCIHRPSKHWNVTYYGPIGTDAARIVARDLLNPAEGIVLAEAHYNSPAEEFMQ